MWIKLDNSEIWARSVTKLKVYNGKTIGALSCTVSPGAVVPIDQYIMIGSVISVENVDKTMARNARKNHFHEASDGGWECDDGYIWSNKGTYCVKDKGFNKNNCPPAWQNDDGSCKKGW